MKFLIGAFAAILILATAAPSFAWTRARLSNVDVALQIFPSDESTFTTRARFEVSGGQFHGFDLAPQANARLIADECYAQVEGGLRAHVKVKVKELFDGRTRIILANKESIHDGAVVFTLVHKINLQESGALYKHNGRARLDWTPIVWDHGTDAMSVQVTLPRTSTTFDFENEATRDYVVQNRSHQSVTFKKHRTVKWYPMQVVIDFDKELVLLKTTPDVISDSAEKTESSTAQVAAPEKIPPFWVTVLPSIIALIGLFLMMIKVKGVHKIHADVGVASRFKLLRHTGTTARFILSICALGLAAAAQFFGSVAASVPPLAIAAALWLLDRSEGTIIPRPGGKWRPLATEEVVDLRKVLAAYQRRRFSVLDISYGLGAAAFLAACAGIIYCAWQVKSDFPQSVWGIAISGVIWVLPIWFSFTHAELPVDPTIESFHMLKKWKRGLSKLVGKLNPDAEANYWIREDEQGPIEIRLRVHPAPAELTGLEIATEVIKAQNTHKVRKVAILKMLPGTDAARKLAACPNAAEHHLTPDLQEEIIVLRNRRGQRDAGFTPLRNALSLIRG
ncbi:MAG: hypothetical protein JXX29_06030 [Deltaproteobacteria bacterium]|nr:hypothetical protein [Deltaproteobacteria bacterium]MBN2671208.1 hypothetical protein [Deltaproteobacteria bacterium]